MIQREPCHSPSAGAPVRAAKHEEMGPSASQGAHKQPHGVPNWLLGWGGILLYLTGAAMMVYRIGHYTRTTPDGIFQSPTFLPGAAIHILGSVLLHLSMRDA